jgi:hypothetical protein
VATLSKPALHQLNPALYRGRGDPAGLADRLLARAQEKIAFDQRVAAEPPCQV